MAEGHDPRIPSLLGTIAAVAGASRGAGRGIALALGEAGATVYVIGRTRRESPRADGLAGNIDDTAAEVTARGGVGIAVPADLTVEDDVARAFARIEAEQGRLDVLANAVWGGGDAHASTEEWMAAWGRPFWERPGAWRHTMGAGPHAYFLSSAYAARLMATTGGGLIVGVTDFVMDDASAAGAAAGYAGDLLSDLAHHTINRLMFDIAQDGRAHGIAAVALMPGFMRTEAVEAFMTSEALRRQFGYDRSESPEYLGRAVAALAADPNVMDRVGRVQFVADLAVEYGFTDVDGRVHPRFDPHGSAEGKSDG